MSPAVIKYLIIILLASFLFACAAEARPNKQGLQINKTR